MFKIHSYGVSSFQFEFCLHMNMYVDHQNLCTHIIPCLQWSLENIQLKCRFVIILRFVHNEGRNKFTTTLGYKDNSHKSRESKHLYTLKYQMTTCMFSLVLTIKYQLNPHDARKSDYFRTVYSKSYDRGSFIVMFWFGLVLGDFNRTQQGSSGEIVCRRW